MHYWCYNIKSYCAEESWTAAKTTTAARRMVVFIMPLNSRCCSEQVVLTRLFSLFAQSIQVKSVEEVASCRFYSRLLIAACAQTWVSINTRMRTSNCRFLELLYTSNFTDEILSHSVDSIRSLKKRIPWLMLITPFYYIERSKNHQSQKLQQPLSREAGWSSETQCWTMALMEIFPLFPSSSCCVNCLLTECVPWNYVTLSPS